MVDKYKVVVYVNGFKRWYFNGKLEKSGGTEPPIENRYGYKYYMQGSYPPPTRRVHGSQ